MIILTERAAEKYVATDGVECPFCGSNKVSTKGDIFYLHRAMAQFAECDNCKKSWQNTYKLTGIMYEELINNNWNVDEYDFF